MISLNTEAEALTMSWQPLAAFTIPRRFRAFTSVTAMVLLRPRKRRARSGSRSPHQTVCPCRSSSCARRDPVAPAPKMKIRMAWAKLYHRVRGAIADRLRLHPQFSLDSTEPELRLFSYRNTLWHVTPTSAAYGRNNLRRQGLCPGN